MIIFLHLKCIFHYHFTRNAFYGTVVCGKVRFHTYIQYIHTYIHTVHTYIQYIHTYIYTVHVMGFQEYDCVSTSKFSNFDVS